MKNLITREMYKEMRSRKIQKLDREKMYRIGETEKNRKAMDIFKTPAYKTGGERNVADSRQ